MPPIAASTATTGRKVTHPAACPTSLPTASHPTSTLRRKPCRPIDHAVTSDLLNCSLIVSTSVTSLAPSDTGTYVIAKTRTLADKSFLLREPELDSLTPHGSLINLVGITEMPQGNSLTDPISTDCEPESTRMAHGNPAYQSNGPDYGTATKCLNVESALYSNGMVLTDTEDTGISVCSSNHITKTTLSATERYQDDLDFNRTAELVHSPNGLNDSLLVSASVISLAPSFAGTYVLDVDDTLASHGVPPVVIHSREDLLHSAESLSRPQHLVNHGSIDDLTPAQDFHASQHLTWMTTECDQRGKDFVVVRSPMQPLSPQQSTHHDANGLAGTNSLGSPREHSRRGAEYEDSSFTSLRFYPSSLEVSASTNGSFPVESDPVPFGLFAQSGMFWNDETTVRSTPMCTNSLPTTAKDSYGSRASVGSGQFFSQDLSHQIDAYSFSLGTQSCSRPSAYPVRLPCPAQTPTLSSESSSPTQNSAALPFSDKSDEPVESRAEESLLLVSSSGTASSVIDPLVDIRHCYRALQASVSYLIQHTEGSIGAIGQKPVRGKMDCQNDAVDPTSTQQRLYKWSPTPTSNASIFHTNGMAPFDGTRKSIRRLYSQHQRHSTASLDSALDGFRDVFPSTCGNIPFSTNLTRNGSASVPQPSSPLQVDGKRFPWVVHTEPIIQGNPSISARVHTSTAFVTNREDNWYTIPSEKADFCLPSLSINFRGLDVTGVTAVAEPCSAPPVPHKRMVSTPVVDSQTLAARQNGNQAPDIDHSFVDSGTYRTWMADLAALSEGIDNLTHTHMFQEDGRKRADLKIPTTEHKSRCELPDSTTGPLTTDALLSEFIDPTPQRSTSSTCKDGIGYVGTCVHEVSHYPHRMNVSEASSGTKAVLRDPNETAMYYTLMVNSIRHLSLKLRQCSDKLIERASSERSNITNTPQWTNNGASYTSSAGGISNSTKCALNDALENMRTINEQLRIVDRLLFSDNRSAQGVLHSHKFLPTLSKTHHTPSSELWSRLQAEPHPISSEPETTLLRLGNESRSVTTGQTENSRPSINTKWPAPNNAGGPPSHLIELNRNGDDEEYY